MHQMPHGTSVPWEIMGQELCERIHKIYADRLGLRDISPHTLRHTCATHLLQAGMGIRELQEILGHSSIVTTEVYTHLSVDHIRAVYMQAHPRARIGGMRHGQPV